MVPTIALALLGAIVIETKVGPPTLNVVEVEMEPAAAVMAALPCVALVANPALPTALLIMATSEFDELQIATEVRFCVLPSL